MKYFPKIIIILVIIVSLGVLVGFQIMINTNKNRGTDKSLNKELSEESCNVLQSSEAISTCRIKSATAIAKSTKNIQYCVDKLTKGESVQCVKNVAKSVEECQTYVLKIFMKDPLYYGNIAMYKYTKNHPDEIAHQACVPVYKAK